MMKNIFIPESVGAYYLFKQRIVGFFIDDAIIYATLIVVHGRTRTVELSVQESLESNDSLSYRDRVINALKRLQTVLGHYDSAHVAISGSLAVFKELVFPFTSHRKIELVLPFEVEPLLPFPLADAVLDFIITAEDREKSTIMVAAFQKSVIEDHRNLFIAAGIVPRKIVVDIFQLYALYKNFVDHKQMSDAVLLLDIGESSMRLGLSVHGQLRSVRIIQRGISGVTNFLNAHEKDGIDAAQKEIKELVAASLSEVSFTVQAFLNRFEIRSETTRICISGIGAEIKVIIDLITETLGISTEKLQIRDVKKDDITLSVSGNQALAERFVISAAAALPLQDTILFNLLPAGTDLDDERLITRQLLVAAVLLGAILGAFAVYSFFTIRALKKEARDREQETVTSLLRAFPGIRRASKTGTRVSLATLNNEARREVTKEKAIWFALSSRNRSSLLTYLLELSTRIDRQGVGLVLEQLTIKGENLILKGTVGDFNALRLFEDDLRKSKLFRNVPKLEETKFNVTVMLDTTDKEN
jgi:Tfp pilus assembly PilM family ATPase